MFRNAVFEKRFGSKCGFVQDAVLLKFRCIPYYLSNFKNSTNWNIPVVVVVVVIVVVVVVVVVVVAVVVVVKPMISF